MHGPAQPQLAGMESQRNQQPQCNPLPRPAAQCSAQRQQQRRAGTDVDEKIQYLHPQPPLFANENQYDYFNRHECENAVDDSAALEKSIHRWEMAR
jgi:hypothetical protein